VYNKATWLWLPLSAHIAQLENGCAKFKNYAPRRYLGEYAWGLGAGGKGTIFARASTTSIRWAIGSLPIAS